MSDRFRGKYIAGNNAAFPAGLQGVLTVSNILANAQGNNYWRLTTANNYAYYAAGLGISLNPNPAPPMQFNYDAFSSSDGSILVSLAAPYTDSATVFMPAGIINVSFATAQNLSGSNPSSTAAVTPLALKQAAQLQPVAFGITLGALSAASLSATDVTSIALSSNSITSTQLIAATAFATNTTATTISAATVIAPVMSGTNCYAVSTFNATVSGSCIGTATNVSAVLNTYAVESSSTFTYSSISFTGLQVLVTRSTPVASNSIYVVRTSCSIAENNYSSQVGALYVYRHNASFGSAGASVPAGATQVLDINRSGAYNYNGCQLILLNCGLTAFQTNSASFYLGLFAYAPSSGAIYYPDMSVEELVA